MLKSNPEDGKVDKIISEIELEDAQKLKLIGTATGLTPGHCFYIGLTHKENFFERVVAYRIFKSDRAIELSTSEKTEYISIDFYEIEKREIELGFHN